jgi:LTXXQ motif family protein
MTRFLKAATLAMTLSVLALVPAAAQNGDDDGPMMGMMGGDCPMMGMMGHGMGGKGMMGRHFQQMGAMAEGRLAYLKNALNITEAQSEAWKGYAEMVMARVKLMQEMRKSMMEAMDDGSAIERMDARINGMTAMLDALKALKPATEKLYAVLTPQQKDVADDLIGSDCGAM